MSKAFTEPAEIKEHPFPLAPAALNESAVSKPVKQTPIDKIPHKPVLWFILIRERPVEDVTKGGVFLTDQVQFAKEMLAYYGEVVAMGPLCYKHSKFSGGGSQCKVGDWVIVGRYAGQKMKSKKTGEVFRMITDDMVMGVTTDPDDLLVYAG